LIFEGFGAEFGGERGEAIAIGIGHRLRPGGCKTGGCETKGLLHVMHNSVDVKGDFEWGCADALGKRSLIELAFFTTLQCFGLRSSNFRR
jgi:hypothetical protein